MQGGGWTDHKEWTRLMGLAAILLLCFPSRMCHWSCCWLASAAKNIEGPTSSSCF
jgi:hypothetical protein